MTARDTLMFRITTDIRDTEIVLKVEGLLAGAFVPELDAAWRAAASTVPPRQIRIDLTDVCHVDAAGRNLMSVMYHAGVTFVCSGCVMPELVREISTTAEAAGRVEQWAR
jgi:hypothetical protein